MLRSFVSFILYSLITLLGLNQALAQSTIQPGHWAVVGEQGPGSGINISIQNQRIALTLFTYNAQGEPTWFLANTALLAQQTEVQARLFSARHGTPLEQRFDPATLVDTGRDIQIVFTGTASASITLDGTTKTIRYLQFTGDSVTIPGVTSTIVPNEIPDLTGEWLFITRHPQRPTQIQPLRLRRLSTTEPQPTDTPDASVIYIHEQNTLSRAFFYCRADIPNADTTPICRLRLVENERLSEYSIPIENITPQRFDANIIGSSETTSPQVFALRLGD